jgi:wyosine [tRNA(Phe)-imidazoG37] synthetase (radical SAM superfamily)
MRVPNQGESALISDHRRQWRTCRYVYPVISRRARGLSIGVNLNPDKHCTFACLYCQIDRSAGRGGHHVDLAALRQELDLALGEASGGALWREERFAATPARLRRINDIAFSGDGEPTCLTNFDEAVAAAAEARRAAGLGELKIVAITNSTQLASPQVRRALPILDANHGEIWAKLDAGSEEFFGKINRPAPGLTLAGVLAGITEVARSRPIVIQTLLCRLEGVPPPAAEIDAYCRRLRQIIVGGGQIKLVQIHTPARPPADGRVSALPDAQLDALGEGIRASVPGLTVEVFHAG